MDEKTNTTVSTSVDPTVLKNPQMDAKPPVESPLVKKIESKNMKKTLSMVLASVVVVLAGVTTGWFLSGTSAKTQVTKSGGSEVVVNADKEVTEAGISDEATFRDSAEGILKEGGIQGEGTHYLDRDLGEDKYVYLTSTVIDLDAFVDKKVTVWGETISAKRAGWLMDVGKVKVVE